jgi:hypothetical protein
MIDRSICPAVESRPGIDRGAWVFRGARAPLAALFENLEGGASVSDLAAAEAAGFEALVTTDQNLAYQQGLSREAVAGEHRIPSSRQC